jgi:5'-nucleotidase
MKILLTNDDGVDAPGLRALQRAAAALGQHVVLAPHVHQSGCSHQATTSRPLALTRLEADRHMLDGSQYVRQQPIDWDQAERWTRHVLRLLLERPVVPGRFWNVNLPQPADSSGTAAVLECIDCPLDPNPLPVHFERVDNQYVYRGVYHQRSRIPGSDIDRCFGGQIAITEIALVGASPQHSELRRR